MNSRDGRPSPSRAERYQAFLDRATDLLSSSLDFETTLANLASLAVPDIIDWCAVDLLEGDEVRRIAVTHRDPSKVELAHELSRRYPIRRGDKNPVMRVIETGVAGFSPLIPPEALELSAYDADHLGILKELGVRSALVAPLMAEGRCVGSVSYVTAESGRILDEVDRSFLEELTRRAGLAVTNATLFHRERESRERLARLQNLTAALARAATPEEVARAAVTVGVEGLGYDSALVYMVEDVLRVSASRVAETASPLSLELPKNERSPAGFAALRGAPVWLESGSELVRRFPDFVPALGNGGRRAAACVPLQVDTRVLGVLAFCYSRDHVYPQQERDFILTVAHNCAQAMERARLLDAAREATRQAEEANRIKDEFLGVVNHELRTPLNAILGWTQLMTSKIEDPAAILKGLSVIQRNAQIQTKLVEDMLDMSRIVNGRMRIDLRPMDLAKTVRDALDVVRPSAEAKRIELDIEQVEPTRPIHGDPDRLQQVVWNLLSNAIRFTETGGSVAIGLGHSDGRAELTVKDTGAGIDPRFLPWVFDRFRQADSSSTRRHGGLGLGLAIVRHIVDLHGGTVEAVSPGLGQGSTFRVRLPTAGKGS